MPTFQELQDRLKMARERKAILIYLIEHIDSNFLPVGGEEPKRRLLTDDKVAVPVEAFEAMQVGTLSAEAQQIEQEITTILSGAVGPVVPPPVPSNGATPATPPRPRRRGRQRRTQGERA